MTSLRTAGARLSLEGLGKTYGRTVDALRDVDLTVTPGEFLTLLSPSGSGKTTLLMIVAGFESPTTGRVLLGSDDITWTAPERRSFGVVFQNYALFPHMSVGRNVAYPLQVRHLPRDKRRPWSQTCSAWSGWRDSSADDLLNSPAVSSNGWRTPRCARPGDERADAG